MARSVSSRLDACLGPFVDVFIQGRLSEISFAAPVRRIDIICLIRGCSECFDKNKTTSVQLPAPEAARKNGSKQGSKETRKGGSKEREAGRKERRKRSKNKGGSKPVKKRRKEGIGGWSDQENQSGSRQLQDILLILCLVSQWNLYCAIVVVPHLPGEGC